MDSEALGKLAKDIENLRLESLFEESGDSGVLGLEAEQHYLLCLAALDSAIRFATLAKYAQMQKR